MIRVCVWIVALGGVAMAWWSAGPRAPATAPATDTTAPASQPAFAPLSYYENNCARCHGAYGSMYLPELLGRHSDDELRRIIADMAAGPAQAPLPPDQIDTLLAFHRSIIRNEPYLYRIGANHGEVTPGATVIADPDGAAIPASVTDHTWRFDTPQPGTIAARMGQASIRLSPDETYTHSGN